MSRSVRSVALEFVDQNLSAPSRFIVNEVAQYEEVDKDELYEEIDLIQGMILDRLDLILEGI